MREASVVQQSAVRAAVFWDGLVGLPNDSKKRSG
jgi:hypothetical protein